MTTIKLMNVTAYRPNKQTKLIQIYSLRGAHAN